MSDIETLGVYARQADDYATMMEREAADDPLIDTFIAACPRGAKVLDLGCGPGHFAGRMAHAGLHVDAMDAVPEMVARTSARSGVNARLGRFEDVTQTQEYDGIWAYFSLLHAPRADFATHLEAVARALKPGGVFFIGMKRGTGGKRDTLGRHYEYYERPDLEEHLRSAGLTPIQHWLGRSAGLSGQRDGWIVIRARA